ncbi:MAG: intradiol ring-cleavage dioxygenase [Flavobacteriaceae bacterium]
MKRNEFLTKGIVGLGGVVAMTPLLSADIKRSKSDRFTSDDCVVSPRETKGPFPNKTPSDYVRENIIGDRKGIPLLITLTVLDKTNGCKPLVNALVDVWHCDNEGKYSEYGGNGMQSENLTKEHFLRGRQTADQDGRVSFISIYPGYYQGRAPHVHLEVLNPEGKSLLVSQIAFPHGVSDTVYATENYQGGNYVPNTADGVFGTSLSRNMADSVTGNTSDGYTLLKTIVVNS